MLPHRMQAHEHRPNAPGMSYQRRHQTRSKTETRSRCDPLAGAMDEADFSEQLGWGDGGIASLKSIASSNQVSDFLIVRSANYAVGDKCAIANKKHDIAWKDLAYLFPTN
jgi:hypothetical protein